MQSRIGSKTTIRNLTRLLLHLSQKKNQQRNPLKPTPLPKRANPRLRKKRRKSQSPKLQRKARRKKRERKLMVVMRMGQRTKKARLLNQSKR